MTIRLTQVVIGKRKRFISLKGVHYITFAMDK